MTQLPKEFLIKRNDPNPLWQRYIDWLNTKYNVNWGGDVHNYYGYVTSSTINNFSCHISENNTLGVDDLSMCPDASIITLEYWDKCVNGEKWCVRISTKEILKYCNEYGMCPPYLINEEHIAHFPSPDGESTVYRRIVKGYTLITPEQFKNYVMKENARKIIGYKVPNDLYGGEVKKGTLYKAALNKNYYIPNDEEDHNCITLPKEIVEMWEVVYEDVSKDKIFILNSNKGLFQLTVCKEGFYYSPDKAFIDPQVLKALLIESSTVDVNGYKFVAKLSSINMGCKKNVPISEIEVLIEYWENNFKVI